MATRCWYMVTIVGEDQPGIVARVSQALFEGGCNLGEATMVRLGGSFTIMIMVEHSGEPGALQAMLQGPADALGLHLHLVRIEGRLHAELEPDVRITVSGADRPGIVAQVTSALAGAGLNIVSADTRVAGSPAHPVYIMQIDGQALRGVRALRETLSTITRDGVEATITPIEALVG